jgi:hypothetical protein
MAWSVGHGGLFVQPMINKFQGIVTVNFQVGSGGTPDTFKVALYNNTVTPNFSDTLANAVYLSGQWVTGNEVSGTNWPAGGVNLTTPAMTEVPAGTLSWTCANVSVATTTLATSIYGCLIYDNTLATHYALVAIPFAGAPYGTSAGTFGITWAAAGIFTINLTP